METVFRVEEAVARGDANAAVAAMSELMGGDGLTPIEETEIKIAVAKELQDADEHDAAARILQELLTSLQEKDADFIFIIELLDLLADVELWLGQASSALDHIREAIELSEPIEGMGSKAIRSRLELMMRAALEAGDGEADRIRGDRTDNLESTIAGYDAALEVITREAMPVEWAKTQMNLGIAFANRFRGDRTDNLEIAIAGYDAALEVYTREAMPVEWAKIQMIRAATRKLSEARAAADVIGVRRYQTDGPQKDLIETEEEADFKLVSVHYGTHRKRTGGKNPYDFYRAERAEMTYGKAIVSVPKNREVGTIERPRSRVERRYDEHRLDPGSHFIIKTIDVIDSREMFLDDVAETIDLSDRKEALVFVHGYNTSFADALIRTAQLSVDLETDGAAFVYSWPSRASLWSYVADRNQVIGSFVDDLKDLIASVATSIGAARVHLIAHSLGGQFLLEALGQLAHDHDSPLADEVIFASPDVDVDDFNHGIGKIRHLAPRITVYSSSNDRALQLSGKISRSVRAGATAERVAASEVDAIDTTSAAQGFIAHTDFACTALDDLRAVVWIEKDVGPERRDAILRSDEGQWGRFWRFSPEEPIAEDGPFREALIWARRIGITAAIETASNMISVVEPSADRVAEHIRLQQIASQLQKFAS